MARQSRLEAPGQVHLLSLRGNNAQAVFFGDQDYADALHFAREAQALHPVLVHGFCLLPQAMYWLVTPQEAGALSRWVQQLARRFVRGINARHGRTGTLFEGRFRSGVLQAGTHLLPCMWVLDQWPVQMGLAVSAAEYAHSSAGWYVGQAAAHTGARGALLRSLLSAPPAVWQLGNTPFEREAAYGRELAAQAPGVLPEWWGRLQAGWAVGDAAFLQGLQEQCAGRRILPAARGRPKKAVATATQPR